MEESCLKRLPNSNDLPNIENLKKFGSIFSIKCNENEKDDALFAHVHSTLNSDIPVINVVMKSMITKKAKVNS